MHYQNFVRAASPTLLEGDTFTFPHSPTRYLVRGGPERCIECAGRNFSLCFLFDYCSTTAREEGIHFTKEDEGGIHLPKEGEAE